MRGVRVPGKEKLTIWEEQVARLRDKIEAGENAASALATIGAALDDMAAHQYRQFVGFSSTGDSEADAYQMIVLNLKARMLHDLKALLVGTMNAGSMAQKQVDEGRKNGGTLDV